ncbi:MAG: methylmalonyl-CoA epimerase [Candidatus Aminicenantales bacterium]
MIKRMDHVGIAVKDLEKSLALWRDVLGLNLRTVEEIRERGLRIAILEKGDAPAVELIASSDPETPIARFLAKRGEGIHHICFEVEDIDEAMRELKSVGLHFVQENPQRGAEESRIAFLNPKDINGVLIELKQKKGRVQDS